MHRLAAALIPLLLGLALAAPARAQQVAAADYMNTGLTQATDDGDLKLRLFRIGAAASAPLLLRPDDRLFFGAAYDLLLRKVMYPDGTVIDGRELTGDELIEANRLEDELHLSTLSLFYAHTVNDRWSVSARVSSAYGGDYAALVARGIEPGAAVGASVQLHETFRLSFGLAYVDAIAPVYAAPFVGWTWEPVDWFTSKGSLPRAVVFTFSYWDRMEFDLFGRLEGGAFYVAENDLDIDHFRYLQVQAGGGLGFRIASDLWISFQAGGTPFLRFAPRDEDGDDVYGADYAPTWFARVLIDLRSIPGTKKRPTTYEPAHPVENPEPIHQ